MTFNVSNVSNTLSAQAPSDAQQTFSTQSGSYAISKLPSDIVGVISGFMSVSETRALNTTSNHFYNENKSGLELSKQTEEKAMMAQEDVNAIPLREAEEIRLNNLRATPPEVEVGGEMLQVAPPTFTRSARVYDNNPFA